MKLKFTIAVLFTWFQFNIPYTVAQTIEWTKIIGGGSDEIPYSVCTDFSGNIIISGFFQSPSITIGQTTLNNTSSCYNCYDIFLAQYDLNGNVIWAKSAGGTGMDVPDAIATDDSGNIYMTGSFTSFSIAFGTTILYNQNGSRDDIFLAKYNHDGDLVWAKSMGGSYDDEGLSITIDLNQNIYFCGRFSSSSVIFGSDTLHKTFLNLESDLFISKYDSGGNEIWAKSAGGNWYDQANSITTDLAGNVFVTGFFWSDTIKFDNINLVNADIFSSADIFLAKFSQNGDNIWAKRAGGTGGDEAWSVKVDLNSNILLTGFFRGSNCSFGSHTLNSHNFNRDIFVAKFDSSGLDIWAKGAINPSDAAAHSICIDQLGNSYVVGEFADTIIFDSDTMYNAYPGGDIFVARYDTNGNVYWVKSAGGTPGPFGGSAYAYAVCSDLSNVYIGGLLRDSCMIIGQDTLYNSGSWDALLIKLNTTLINGITKDKNEHAISNLFPNPFHSSASLVLKNNFENAELRIYNALGEQVKHQKITSQETTIYRGNLVDGIYFYQVSCDKGILTSGRLLID